MSYPSDVLLPVDAKYYGFIDTKKKFNIHWDIVWSVSLAISGVEHGFSTFLTPLTGVLSAIPGHYLGYNNTEPLSSVVRTGILAIAFDTTGLFALSSNVNDGVGLSNIKKNSIIIKTEDNTLTYYDMLSSLTTDFLSLSEKTDINLRFHLYNSGKSIKISSTDTHRNDYVTILDVPVNIPLNDNDIYAGFTFCSPISSLKTPSTLFLKNFHTMGNQNPPTYEIITMNTILPSSKSYIGLSPVEGE